MRRGRPGAAGTAEMTLHRHPLSRRVLFRFRLWFSLG